MAVIVVVVIVMVTVAVTVFRVGMRMVVPPCARGQDVEVSQGVRGILAVHAGGLEAGGPG